MRGSWKISRGRVAEWKGRAEERVVLRAVAVVDAVWRVKRGASVSMGRRRARAGQELRRGRAWKAAWVMLAACAMMFREAGGDLAG